MKALIVGLFMFLVACVPNLQGCPIGCTDGTSMIHLSPELIAKGDRDEIVFVILHETGHIVLKHKPWTARKELAADKWALDLAVPMGVNPCPVARLLKQYDENVRAEAIGIDNNCRGFE